MSEKIIRPGVVKRIVDLTKSRNQNYTQEVVNDILTAFFDVVEDAISNGNSINLNGYLTIETQYKKASKASLIISIVLFCTDFHYMIKIY